MTGRIGSTSKVVRSPRLITCSKESIWALRTTLALLEFNVGSHPGDSTHYVNAKDLLSLSLLQGAFDRSQATDQAREIEVKARQRRRAGRPPVIVTAGCGPFCSAKRSPPPCPFCQNGYPSDHRNESQRPSLTSMDRFYFAIIVSALLLLLGASGIFVTRTADLMPHARTVGIAGSR
jgi:hypothetical protein